MNHNWGAPATQPDPLFLQGAHAGRLVSMRQDLQSVNRMPLQTGLPVTVEPLGFDLEQARSGAWEQRQPASVS
jgi:hypothetical protein